MVWKLKINCMNLRQETLKNKKKKVNLHIFQLKAYNVCLKKLKKAFLTWDFLFFLLISDTQFE